MSRFVVIQAQGIRTDDPRPSRLGDPTETQFLLYEGFVPPMSLLGIFGSITELNTFVEKYLDEQHIENRTER